MPFVVPGIGYAGLGQQTAANQAVFRRAMSGGRTASAGSRKRRKSKAKRSAASFRRPRRIPGKSRTRRTRGASKFVKGSAAAKRHMAKLRRMRKR